MTCLTDKKKSAIYHILVTAENVHFIAIHNLAELRAKNLQKCLNALLQIQTQTIQQSNCWMLKN